MKFFQKTNMISEFVPSAMRTGLFQTALGVDAAVDAGAFVIAGELADHEVYNEYLGVGALKDFNVFITRAPVAADVTATAVHLYVVEPIKIGEGIIMDNTYRYGAKTLGLSGLAGEKVAMRKLYQGDQFILGVDNFVSAPTAGEFAVLTADSTELTPAAAKPATGFAVRVECEWGIAQGITPVAGFLCTVVQL